MIQLQSPEIDKLTQAWINAVKDLPAFEADTESRFKKPLISINEIKATAYKSLFANGLKIRQGRMIIEGQWVMFTKVSHVSGQWEMSYAPQVLPDATPNGIDQAWGAALSYQRRYDLYALFGFLGEDNDPDSAGTVSSPSRDETSRVAVSSEYISPKQHEMLKILLKGNSEQEAKICAYYKIPSLDKLSWRNMQEVVNKLKPRTE